MMVRITAGMAEPGGVTRDGRGRFLVPSYIGSCIDIHGPGKGWAEEKLAGKGLMRGKGRRAESGRKKLANHEKGRFLAPRFLRMNYGRAEIRALMIGQRRRQGPENDARGAQQFWTLPQRTSNWKARLIDDLLTYGRTPVGKAGLDKQTVGMCTWCCRTPIEIGPGRTGREKKSLVSSWS